MNSAIHQHLQKWSEELIDLSKRNRLLYFKHTMSASLQFQQAAGEVEKRLDSRGWSFFLPSLESEVGDAQLGERRLVPGKRDLVVEMSPSRDRAQILRGLAGLSRKTQATFLDAGVWTLYLGLGMLHWRDASGKPVQSPLLLVPVQLERRGPDRQWLMVPSDNGDAAVNPTLAVALDRDFDVSIPSLEAMGDGTVEDVMATVADLTSSAGWAVEPTAVLTNFSFHKEAIYRDIQNNMDEIAAHPIIQLLVEGPGSEAAAELGFSPAAYENLDEHTPPEGLLNVLDADGSQRRCILAAREGKSFVIDGPPGTGKSQTITNVIAQLLADGKSVLFVSEKAAALEVVQNRLADLRLDPFVLPLHSHKQSRKAVALELGQALDECPQATSTFDAHELILLAKDRERLSGYAVAVNQVREPLGWSFHDAVGRVSTLPERRGFPLPSIQTEALTAEALVSLKEDAGQLGRNWGPVLKGDDFVWRDLAPQACRPGQEARLKLEVARCLGSLDSLEEEFDFVCDRLSTSGRESPADSERLAELLRLVERRIQVSPDWLAAEDVSVPNEKVKALVGLLHQKSTIESTLESLCPQWDTADLGTTAELDRLLIQAATSEPEIRTDDMRSAEQFAAAAAVAQAVEGNLSEMAGPLNELATAFGLADDTSIAQARRLVDLAHLVGSATPPEAAWLDPNARAALAEARTVLGELLTTYRSRREHLRSTFSEEVLELDLRGLRARFLTVHKGLRKLSSAHRADKRLLAGVTVSGKVDQEIIASLEEAIEWQDLAERLTKAELRHGATVGATYWADREHADLDEIERAIQIADDAVRLAAGDITPDAMASQIGVGAQPSPRIARMAEEVNARLRTHDELSLDPVGLTKADLENLPVSQLLDWAASSRPPFDGINSMLSAVDAAGGPQDIRGAHKLFDLQTSYGEVTCAVEDLASDVVAVSGSKIDLTNPRVLESALEWVSEVRTLFRGPVPEHTARAVLVAEVSSQQLVERAEAWTKTVQQLAQNFLPDQWKEISTELGRNFDAGRSVLEILHSSISDVSEWVGFSEAAGRLTTAGWSEVVEACIELRVPGEAVAEIVERAALQAWINSVIESDSRLTPGRATERDQVVADFRDLDERLVLDSVAHVINRCAARRPSSLLGGAGILKQQAGRKRGHMAVRRLMEAAGDATLQFKPCFMMSPLSVSHFLPMTVEFDTVIFDEASQVREADAIGCIARGKQLIVAGDPKQLPPTMFFERSQDGSDDLEAQEDEVVDYESILDRCKFQGLQELPLNWHYRSRHESLISFSNESFYRGRLNTFPSAAIEAPDLGVEFFRVDGGVYDRGGTKTNAVEAEAVIDRVLLHRVQHPHLSLGVVTLSSSQQLAIEEALLHRAGHEPELQNLLSTDDRLAGFFVKNLESVQGDERDVIILSIGYGRDKHGKMYQNFGPMSRAGGERRLNVAVTRARRRVEVVCSIEPGEIRGSHVAARHLSRYLDFADRGHAALASDLEESHGPPDSPFEEEVLTSATALGLDAVPQVGVAGYRIDIGIRHPERLGSFVLGVECDGATYHSSKVARDRDRLRQQVLEGLGWTIHRIWSTAWFSDRAAEEQRLLAAVEQAIAPPVATTSKEALSPVVEMVARTYDEPPSWAWPYAEPAFEPSQYGESFINRSSQVAISDQIRSALETTGPIHDELLLVALGKAWGFSRAGSRIRDAFSDSVSTLVARGEAKRRGKFLYPVGGEVFVRVPADPDSTRPVKMIPPEELTNAVLGLLREAGSPVDRSDLKTAWARLFGWDRTGRDIDLAFTQALMVLSKSNQIAGTDAGRVLIMG